MIIVLEGRSFLCAVLVLLYQELCFAHKQALNESLDVVCYASLALSIFPKLLKLALLDIRGYYVVSIERI